jgi:hypothetical protein
MSDPSDPPTTDFRASVDSRLWSLWKGTKGPDQENTPALVETLQERVERVLDEELIARSPNFGDEHLEYFREEIVRDGDQ